MDKMVSFVLLPLLTLLLSSCEQVPEEDGPLAVVFAADYLDVYGPLTIEVSGFDSVVLEEEGQFTCNGPAFYVDDPDGQKPPSSHAFSLLQSFAFAGTPRGWARNLILLSSSSSSPRLFDVPRVESLLPVDVLRSIFDAWCCFLLNNHSPKLSF